MARPWSLILVSGILLALLAVPAGAFPQEYTVEPGFGAVGTAAGDIVTLSFGDLTPREMAIVMALAISPLLLVPAEILFALKLLSFLGFRRIVRGNVLNNAVRMAIYRSIRERPGISPGELAGETGTSRGALAYHIALLRATGKIVLVKTHGTNGCFENSGTFSRSELTMVSCFRSEAAQKILRTLAATPGLSRAELGQILGVSGPTVTWHMKRLASDGAVRVSREGKFSRYVLSDDMAAIMKRTGIGTMHCRNSASGDGDPIRAAVLTGPVES